MTVVAVAAPAAANGAYFPTSWGWMALGFAWTAAIVLMTRRTVLLSRLEWAAVTALLALTAWTALSTLWSEDVTQSVLEVERTLVYVTAFVALFVIVRRRTVPQFLAGTLVGITLVSSYALATHLFPERFGHYENRLARPLGYWNGLGIFAVIGCLLALAFAARARPLWGRAFAAALLPVLATTLYFTLGRGPWIALGVGLVATIALDPRRLQFVSTLIVATPGPAIAVWLASRSNGLTTNNPPLSLASREGHRLAPIILALAAAGALALVALNYAEHRLPDLPRGRLAYGAAIWLSTLAGLGALFGVYGDPSTIARKAYHAFQAPPVGATGTGANLNKRLLSFSGNGRIDMWRVAWSDVRDHPWLGSGAGTYEQHWMRRRTSSTAVRDAHSLYLESLAELGPLGLGLLVVTLALPLIAAVRARNRALVSGAFGAYVAYLAHTGADWDWELTAVTLTALFCGAALLIMARDVRHARPVSIRRGTMIVAVMVAAGAFAFVGLVSNIALSASGDATLSENWPRAETEARKAIRWAPWSSEGWRLLGQIQLQQAKFAQARASFRTGISKDRRDWSLWLDLALASEGRPKRIAASVALRLDPLSPEIAQIRSVLGLGSG